MKKCLATLFLLFTSIVGVNLYGDCDCTPPVDCEEQPFRPQGCLTPLLNEYKLRYSVVGERGAMTFIGNTLGLSKADCENEPGTQGSIGTFTTVDASDVVGTFPSLAAGVGSPAGTTIDWTENGSSAVLTLPAGITILYAELVWSGSYGYYCSNPNSGDPFGVLERCVLDFADGPISFITPDNVVHPVVADPMTAEISQNPASDVQPFYCGGNYVRSQNVTALLTALGTGYNGTYTVMGVPATVSRFDATHNAAGWTLAIVYRDPANTNINNMTFFVGAQQGSRGGIELPAEVSGFCAAPSQTIGQTARVLVSAVEGDANLTGDRMQFGPTMATLTDLSGPNNPVDRFFSSQINDDLGELIDTTGTYCIFNQDATIGVNIPNGRQGYDITNVDASATILPNQTTAFARGFTVGDDFMINALGIQINVEAPVIVPIKRVNGEENITAKVGDTVTFSFMIDNTGAGAADNVVFQDMLDASLVFIPGTFLVDGVVVPVTQADIENGVPLGTIPMAPDPGSMMEIEFQAMIVSFPAMGNVIEDQARVTFEFNACNQVDPFVGTNDSNVVTITLDLDPVPDFTGRVKKCPFLNRNLYTLTATWEPAPGAIVYYIYKNGAFVESVPGDGPFVFETCIGSRREAEEFSVVAVYPGNVGTVPANIRIVND